VAVTEKRRRLTAWLEGKGIEIGALHRPLEVPDGVRVTYVDHLPEDELRAHYPELAGEPLAPVEVLGSAEDLSAIGDSTQDFVIANHLLEHLEDPIRGLSEFHRVLRPGGVLYMALPDQRQTFDRDRELTTVEHLVDEHRTGCEKNRWSHYLDWARNVDKQGAGSEAHARRLMEQGYSIHFHVWRPDTFLDFYVAARREAGLDFELVSFAGPEREDDDEFILVLVKGTQAVRPPPRSPCAEPAAPTPPATPSLRSRVRGALVRAVRRGSPAQA